MRKEIGKIKDILVGKGGYQDAMIGVSFELGGIGWGVGDFWGTWGGKRPKEAKWTEEDRSMIMSQTFKRLEKLLDDAKKQDVRGLKNVPVEVEFNNGKLESWRILTEVL